MKMYFRIILVFTLVTAVLLDVEYKRSKRKIFKKNSATFECPSAFGLFANPLNCQWFYTCSAFTAYDTPCPSPLHFDNVKKTCVYKTKDLQCGSVAIAPGESATPDPEASPSCIQSACKLPDCFCSDDGTKVPGNFLPSEIPQMVILAFDGAVNVLNAEPLGYLFNETRRNPNGCPIKATFFVPHEETSYYYVQKLYGQGHEIAMQTVTNKQPKEYWTKANTEEWTEEVMGMKEILHNFANVSKADLIGMRAPFLTPGGNEMFSMMNEFELDYDSSHAAPPSESPLWPYTLDFHMPHKCLGAKCPTRSFAGIWEIPLNSMETDDGTGSCVLLDECGFPDDPLVVFEFLHRNFARHYFNNRAPFMLNLNVNWVTDDSKLTALDYFIDFISENYPDAWFVTVRQALDWVRHPVSSNFAPNYELWKCRRTRSPGCKKARTCALTFMNRNSKETRYLQLCGKCPANYPWLHNARGKRGERKKISELIQQM